jgi:uncharacterized membrane protein
MKEKGTVYYIVLNAIIAAVYAAFTVLIAPIAYSEVQLRLSEIIVLLAFYNKKFIPGLAIGCFIANMASPLGIIDMVVGTLSTLVVCYFMNKATNIYVSAMIGSIATGLIVGAECAIVYNTPFLINAIYVFIGEAIVLFIGTIVYKKLELNSKFMEYIEE